MQEWWDGLGGTLQTFYGIAVSSTVVMILQMVLTSVGLSHDGDTSFDHCGTDCGHDFGGHDGSHDIDLDCYHDHDATHDYGADAAAFRLFTIQGIISFLVVFGWTGVICTKSQVPMLITLLVAAGLGALTLLGVAKMLQMAQKLQSSGNVRIRDALGKTAKVYIPIPPGGHGSGKITLIFDGRFMECDAVTDDDTKLETDTRVRVIDVRDDVLVVERDG